MKRILKIAALALLVFLVFALGLIVFIRVKYPAERLRQILLSTLAQQYGVTAIVQ